MSVMDNIRAGKYANHVPYTVPDLEIDENTTTVRRAKEMRDQHQQDKRDQIRAYQEEAGRLLDLFRADLEAENGLTGHPKAGKLWEISWSRAHSGGLSDVAYFYDDIAELLKPDGEA